MTGKARRLFVLALSLIVLGTQAAAAADGTSEAKRHFEMGVRLAQDRNFASALVEFEASYQRNPTAAALQNIAVCQKNLFRYADAIATLERMLRDFSAQLSASDKRAAGDAIADMRALLGTIVIRTTPADARVTIDERAVSPDDLARPISLAAGQYRIAVEAPGYARAEQTVSVVSGQKDVPVDVVLSPANGPPPPSEGADSAPPPALPQRGWVGYLAITGDTLTGAVPTGHQATGPRQGAAGALIGGYRFGKRFALEGQIEVAGHVLTACLKGEDNCPESRQLKYTLGTVRIGPAARLMSDGRVLRVVGHVGLGAVGHTVSEVKVQPGMTDPFGDKLHGAGGYIALGAGVEFNVKRFLFDVLLAGTVETKGELPVEQRAISSGGLTLRAGYGAWAP
jgi:PEGA domain